MPITIDTTTVNEQFLQLLEQATAAAPSRRPCPEFPDETWIAMGVQRVLEATESGRAFLQEHGLRFEKAPRHDNYFASLRSARRREVAREVDQHIRLQTQARVADRLADIPELARYACFAADGHWHKAAVHDPKHEDRKLAVGHFYALDLRTHTLRHLAAGQGLHEHDMSALKRIKPRGLRQGVAQGTRVLIVYDKAGIDFDFWDRCRRECAVYFLSRVCGSQRCSALSRITPAVLGNTRFARKFVSAAVERVQAKAHFQQVAFDGVQARRFHSPALLLFATWPNRTTI